MKLSRFSLGIFYMEFAEIIAVLSKTSSGNRSGLGRLFFNLFSLKYELSNPVIAVSEGSYL